MVSSIYIGLYVNIISQLIHESIGKVCIGFPLHNYTSRGFQQSGMCDQQSLRSACAYAQSDQSLCLSLEYSMSVMLLTEHHLEFRRLIGGCTGSSDSTLVKMSHCWEPCVAAQL